MKRLFWLHDENLSLPLDLTEEDQLIYIWDNAYLNAQAWSFKRQLFIYESLCELPVTIWQGDTCQVLLELSQTTSFDEIRVQTALDPILQQLIRQASALLPTLVQTPYPQLFAEYQLKPCQRFHAYWKQVAPLLGLEKTHQKWH